MIRALFAHVVVSCMQFTRPILVQKSTSLTMLIKHLPGTIPLKQAQNGNLWPRQEALELPNRFDYEEPLPGIQSNVYTDIHK